VHYPSDVLAGYATGFLWLFISIYIMNRVESFSNKKLDPIVESESAVTE
jgi:membrane-associated phospholipid phosphatase